MNDSIEFLCEQADWCMSNNILFYSVSFSYPLRIQFLRMNKRIQLNALCTLDSHLQSNFRTEFLFMHIFVCVDIK